MTAERGMTLIEMMIALAVGSAIVAVTYAGVTHFGAHHDGEQRRMAAMDTAKLVNAEIERRFVDRRVGYAGTAVAPTVASPGYRLGGCGLGACQSISVTFTDTQNLTAQVTLTATTSCRAKPGPAGPYKTADFSMVGKACVVCGKGQLPYVTLAYSDGRPGQTFPEQARPNGAARIAAAAAMCVQPLPGTGELRLVADAGYLDGQGQARAAEDIVLVSTNLPRNMQLIK